MPPEDEVTTLTPEDVSNKRFTPVRLREGYDMGEVDQFLDQVEAELERLLKENNDLRSKLAAAQSGRPEPVPAPPPVADVAEKPEAAEEPEPEPEVAPAPLETIKVVTAAEASGAALRLLELATRNADEVVAEAKEEAQQIVGAAKTQAETLEQEARARAHNVDAETEAKRTELLGDMERERTRLDSEVDTLRAFEREYRSRLKSYFTEQLQALDGIGEGGDLPVPSGGLAQGPPVALHKSDQGSPDAEQDQEPDGSDGEGGHEGGDDGQDSQDTGQESEENPRSE